MTVSPSTIVRRPVSWCGRAALPGRPRRSCRSSVRRHRGRASGLQRVADVGLGRALGRAAAHVRRARASAIAAAARHAGHLAGVLDPPELLRPAGPSGSRSRSAARAVQVAWVRCSASASTGPARLAAATRSAVIVGRGCARRRRRRRCRRPRCRSRRAPAVPAVGHEGAVARARRRPSRASRRSRSASGCSTGSTPPSCARRAARADAPSDAVVAVGQRGGGSHRLVCHAAADPRARPDPVRSGRGRRRRRGSPARSRGRRSRRSCRWRRGRSRWCAATARGRSGLERCSSTIGPSNAASASCRLQA